MTRRIALLLLALLPATALAADEAKPAAPVKVRLKTSKGDILLELNPDKAPITVANFLDYVKKGQYDGTVFHRVINSFMIQGGGFAVEEGKLTEKATGKGIKNESKNGLSNARGTIAMARTNDPDSATAQFFINVADNTALDFPNYGGYAVFGKVIQGMEVVDAIKAVATSPQMLWSRDPQSGVKSESPSTDVPVEAVIIVKATIEP